MRSLLAWRDRMSRPIVLVFVRYFLPGFKAGGPVRSIDNLVGHLGDEFDFHVVTSDRDLGDAVAYPGVTADAQAKVGKARVTYLSPREQGFRGICRLLRGTPHDAVYLNSFFDPVFSAVPLLLRRLELTPRKPYLVAPRGEFSRGALALKAWKKQLYLRAVRAGGLFRNVGWQASSEYEAAEIVHAFEVDLGHICVAPNPAPLESDQCHAVAAVHRDPGMPLRVVFLSRVSPKKNLRLALRVIARIQEPVLFDIYGPVTDETYWQRCQMDIAALPSHVRVNYRGAVPPDQVRDIMSSHDLFFLPTLGENFGHAIAEALSAGTPVLIADTTPWRDLEAAGVGWDLSLDDEQSFLRCIEHCAKLGAAEYEAWRASIRRFAADRLRDPEVIKTNRTLLLNTLAEGR
jgi:glycosyltransferase involved in cell wall biosynthesis